MIVKVYVDGLSPPEDDRMVDMTVRLLVHYLRCEQGREDIAMWERELTNTVWHGRPAGLYCGVPVTYRRSEN